MYIDLIVLILLIFVVIMFFKNYQSFVFLIAIIDIFLRILSFIKNNIGLPDVSYIIGKYFPNSIFDIIETYTNGTLSLIIKWAFVIVMINFLFYITRIFLRKKKI